MRTLSTVALFLSLTLTLALTAFAEDPAEKQPSPEEMQKMMAAWEKSATPGAPHQLLAKLAGEWTTSNKMWMTRGAEVQESKGTAKSEMTFGGRWLQSEDHFEMMGQPFNGHGILGYDNITKKFSMFWASDMGCEPTYCLGDLSADGKTITFTGTAHEPWDGSAKTVKYAYTIVDSNKFVLEGFDLVGGPKEFRVLEMTYTRK